MQRMEELDILPMKHGFNEFQWLDFKNYIKSKEFKDCSVKGKAARDKQKRTKVTGSKAYAAISYEFEKKKKRKAGHVEFFDLCNKREDGSYVNNKTKKFMRLAKKELSDYQAAGGKNLLEKEKAIWDKHMGPDKPGQARDYGVGVTKSQVSGFRATLEQITWEDELAHNASSTELNKLKDQLAQQQELISQQQQMMKQYMANTTTVIGQLQSELRIYKTAFAEQFHANS